MSPLCRTVSQTGLSSLKLTDDTYIGGVDTICRDVSIITYIFLICKNYLCIFCQKTEQTAKKRSTPVDALRNMLAIELVEPLVPAAPLAVLLVGNIKAKEGNIVTGSHILFSNKANDLSLRCHIHLCSNTHIGFC